MGGRQLPGEFLVFVVKIITGPVRPYVLYIFSITAPSQAPRNFSSTAVTSTIITASWQLPPADSRNGMIKGFKLFYKRKGSAESPTISPISNGTEFNRDVSGLVSNTKYEFEVLAFTSVGDGPKTFPVVVRTMKGGESSKKMFNTF